MTDIATTEPGSIISGDLMQWTKSLSGYLPTEYTLTYALVKDGTLIEITATDNGDGSFLVSELPATTAAYSVGIYKWQAYASKTGERCTVDSGTMEVEANFASQSTGYDDRSHVKKTLDALEALIEGRSTTDSSGYSIAGRSITKMEIEDLITWRDKYKYYYSQEIAAENIANGKASGKKILVRF